MAPAMATTSKQSHVSSAVQEDPIAKVSATPSDSLNMSTSDDQTSDDDGHTHHPREIAQPDVGTGLTEQLVTVSSSDDGSNLHESHNADARPVIESAMSGTSVASESRPRSTTVRGVNRETRETQTEYSPESAEALAICLDVVDLALDKNRDVKFWETWKPRSSSSTTMFQLANEILDGHAIVYKSMVDKLELMTRRNYWSVKSMCDEVFRGGDISWGRIVAVYAVCVQLARSCRQQQHDTEMAYSMADTIGHYMSGTVADWISRKGGWNSLVEEFPPKDDIQNKVWKGLLVTGLSLGMFATVIKAIR